MQKFIIYTKHINENRNKIKRHKIDRKNNRKKIKSNFNYLIKQQIYIYI